MTAQIVTRHARIPRYCGCEHPVHLEGPCGLCKCPASCRYCHSWGFVIRRVCSDDYDEKEADDCPKGCK